jgi:ribosomal protein S18 acetylase RimI-like enzyme
VELRLRPLVDDELAEFIAASRSEYVQGLIEHARLPAEFAERKAERDLAAYEGPIPDRHSFHWIEHDGGRVGRLWFEERESPRLGRIVWLNEIEIDAPFRGRGYGRTAMRLLEEDVRARGIQEIVLNVWGGNDVARSLYRAIGYFERSVEMAKELK